MILINFIITKILTKIQFYSFNDILEIIIQNSLLKNSLLKNNFVLKKNNSIQNSIENIIFNNNRNYMDQNNNFTLYQENNNNNNDCEINFKCNCDFDNDCDYGWYVILDV